MQRAKLSVVAACLLAAAAPRLAAQQFDGVIQFVSYEGHQDLPDTITQMTKGNKLRMEGMGRGGAMVMNGSSRIIILPEQKQYMEMPMDMGRGAAQRESMKHRGVAEKTGKSETIAGISCEDWHYKGTDDHDQPTEGDVCVARGAGLMISRLAGGMAEHMFDQGGPAFNEEIKKGSGLLKATRNGKVSFIAIKAQATSVPDAMFAPPSDYTKLDMSQMGMPHKP